MRKIEKRFKKNDDKRMNLELKAEKKLAIWRGIALCRCDIKRG